MKKNRQLALILCSAAALQAAILIPVIGNNNKPVAADETTHSVTLNNEALQAITYEDYSLALSHSGGDKKFQVPVDDGGYIEGALLFNDCGKQSVGTSLGSEFSMGVSTTDQYNFNFIFAAHHLLDFNVTFKVMIDGTASGSNCFTTYGKFTTLGDSTTSLYDKISSAEEDSDYYSSIIGLGDFWSHKETAAGGEYDGKITSNAGWSSQSGYTEFGGSTYNLMAINFRAVSDPLPSDMTIHFQIESLTLRYKC